MATISEATRRWRMVEAGALLAVSIALFVIIPLAQEVIPPVLIFGGLYLALAALVWRLIENRWIAGIAGGLALAGLAANAPFLAEDLSHPETWATFVPSVISVIAGLVAAFAAIASYRGIAEPLARTTVRGAAGLGAALVVLSVVMWVTAASDEAEAGDIAVRAEKHYYPESVQAAAGSVGLLIENGDLMRHTFVLVGRDVKVEVPGGKSRRVSLDLPVGTYPYICDVPGHERMSGVLLVQ